MLQRQTSRIIAIEESQCKSKIELLSVTDLRWRATSMKDSGQIQSRHRERTAGAQMQSTVPSRPDAGARQSVGIHLPWPVRASAAGHQRGKQCGALLRPA